MSSETVENIVPQLYERLSKINYQNELPIVAADLMKILKDAEKAELIE